MNITEKLNQIISKDAIIEHADMARYTSFRAGGCADLFITVQSIEELMAVLQLLEQEAYPFCFFCCVTGDFQMIKFFRSAD